ncbi:uncharacterized protein METZ01_LOCUS247703 [marine metagenome]|uniref:Uncharacterized protein n=1 Tax=marine metagenome TaxID=408172 RepID=A0A382I6G2_9ZZZZ
MNKTSIKEMRKVCLHGGDGVVHGTPSRRTEGGALVALIDSSSPLIATTVSY